MEEIENQFPVFSFRFSVVYRAGGTWFGNLADGLQFKMLIAESLLRICSVYPAGLGLVQMHDLGAGGLVCVDATSAAGGPS